MIAGIPTDTTPGIPDQSGRFPDRPGSPVSRVDYPWEPHRTPPSHQRGKTRPAAQGRWKYYFTLT